ncbi:hypothetical protein V1514DRAFT_334585 [Lipomyces japonicus]|uniref:uncharacterized protein n=1 Tax=Lipomyces japonicus TaxID=56871 RepID=UPI0034CF9551
MYDKKRKTRQPLIKMARAYGNVLEQSNKREFSFFFFFFRTCMHVTPFFGLCRSELGFIVQNFFFFLAPWLMICMIRETLHVGWVRKIWCALNPLQILYHCRK